MAYDLTQQERFITRQFSTHCSTASENYVCGRALNIRPPVQLPLETDLATQAHQHELTIATERHRVPWFTSSLFSPSADVGTCTAQNSAPLRFAVSSRRTGFTGSVTARTARFVFDSKKYCDRGPRIGGFALIALATAAQDNERRPSKWGKDLPLRQHPWPFKRCGAVWLPD
jgi:hypothetical protein